MAAYGTVLLLRALAWVGDATAALPEACLDAPFVLSGTTQPTGQLRVERVFRLPPMVSLSTGESIQVQSQQRWPAPGTPVQLCAEAWMLGERVTLRELHRLERASSARRLRRMEPVPLRPALGSRLDEVELVVLGTIERIRPVEGSPDEEREHAPRWWRAEVRLQRVLSGEVEGQRIEVLIPWSRDIAWAAMPRPEPGLTAVFLARRDAATGAWALGSPLDLQPREMRPWIRDQLREQP